MISELKLNDESSKNKAIKKTRPSKKAIVVYFAVIDEITKIIIPHAALKFGKKPKTKNDLLVYHDSISCYSAEFLNSNNLEPNKMELQKQHLRLIDQLILK